MSRPARGHDLDRHLARDVRLPVARGRLTSMTAPVVSEARKVMMATTATSARPEIELRGTSGVSKRGGGTAGTASAPA